MLNYCLCTGKGRIFDIRTQQSAQHRQSKGILECPRVYKSILILLGGGVEFPSNYSQWRVEYGSMESITNIQSSYLKLIEGTTPSLPFFCPFLLPPFLSPSPSLPPSFSPSLLLSLSPSLRYVLVVFVILFFVCLLSLLRCKQFLMVWPPRGIRLAHSRRAVTESCKARGTLCLSRR